MGSNAFTRAFAQLVADFLNLVTESDHHSDKFNRIYSSFDKTNTAIQQANMTTDAGWNAVHSSFTTLAAEISSNIRTESIAEDDYIDDADRADSIGESAAALRKLAASANAFALILLAIHNAISCEYPLASALPTVDRRVGFMLNILKQMGINLNALKVYSLDGLSNPYNIYAFIEKDSIRIRLDDIFTRLSTIDVTASASLETTTHAHNMLQVWDSLHRLIAIVDKLKQ